MTAPPLAPFTRRHRFYLYRVLDPAQERAICRAHSSGVSAERLAAEYGVARRTIYRILDRRGERSIEVTVDGWHATFVLNEEGPVRVTPWYPE